MIGLLFWDALWMVNSLSHMSNHAQAFKMNFVLEGLLPAESKLQDKMDLDSLQCI